MPRNSRHTGYFTYPSLAEVFSSTYPRPNIPAFSSFRNIATTEIIVGLEKASFHVHTNILVAESTYFKAALTSGFEERDTKKISLSDNRPETVELFVQWCYHQPARYSVIVEQKLLQLVQLYYFADSCMIPRLKNDMIWELFYIRRSEHTLPKTCVEYAFAHLPENCPLLRLLAAWYAWHPRSAEQLTRMDLESLPAFSAELNFQQFARSHKQKMDPFSENPNVFYEKDSAHMTAKTISANESIDEEPVPKSPSIEDEPPMEPDLPALPLS